MNDKVTETDHDSASLIAQLLHDVITAGEYRVSYLEGSRESTMLRKMAGMDLIHWCPYPDECYVITAVGRTLLSNSDKTKE